MRFFSKVTVFCNVCFLLAVVFWFIEQRNKGLGESDQVLPLPWLEGTFVILGYLAILVNLLFLLLYFIFYSFKVNMKVSRWIIVFNIIIFCGQVFFHFVYK